MKILNLKEIHNFVVISDVHLRNPQDKLSQLFISTLSSLDPADIDAVFLLGDIFDFIAVKSPYFFKLWKNIFDAFKSLKEKGVQIYFIEGNHDFGFEHFKSSFLDACFTNYGDFIIELNHQKLGLVHLRHGDDIVCKPDYLAFRKLVKAKYFQKIASFLFSGSFMQFIFSRYAKLSRKKDKYRTLSQEFLVSCIGKSIFLNPQMNVLIIGHIHIQSDFIVKNRVRLLSGYDWISNPNILIYNDSRGFYRINI